MNKKDNVKLCVMIDRLTEERARNEAELENRSMSNYVETILKKYFASIDAEEE